MTLTETAGKVMGALAEQGGRMPPSVLRSEYEEAFHTPDHQNSLPPELHFAGVAIDNIEAGIQEVIHHGLAEFDRTANCLKMLVLTDKGKELIRGD